MSKRNLYEEYKEWFRYQRGVTKHPGDCECNDCQLAVSDALDVLGVDDESELTDDDADADWPPTLREWQDIGRGPET